MIFENEDEMIDEDDLSDGKKSYSCKICFENKADCICSRITHDYPGRTQDIPVDDLTEEEWTMYFPDGD